MLKCDNFLRYISNFILKIYFLSDRYCDRVVNYKTMRSDF